jgi:tetratricopeptide (TPR) repeat protein
VGKSIARRNLAFRHELARQAVEDSLPVGRARFLHAQILAALRPREGEEVSLARLVHHAVRAGDEETTLRLAPQAARQASALGAHRAAISLYASVLRYRSRLSSETQAKLLEDLSFENYLIGHIEEAIQLRQQAILIWQGLDRGDRVGDGHRWLSRLYWTAGNGVAAEKHVDRAVEILMSQPAGPELAMAFSAKSQLYMLAWEEEPALEWGNRALDLAEKLGVVEIQIHAMTNIRSIDMLRDLQVGADKIQFALQLAREHEMTFRRTTLRHRRT